MPDLPDQGDWQLGEYSGMGGFHWKPPFQTLSFRTQGSDKFKFCTANGSWCQTTLGAPGKFSARYDLGSERRGDFEAELNPDGSLKIEFLNQGFTSYGNPRSGGVIIQAKPTNQPKPFVAAEPGSLTSPPTSDLSFDGRLEAFLGVTCGANPAIRQWVAHAAKTRGLAAAGPHSIGIVAYPRTTFTNIVKGRVPIIPETTQLLGHTAEILRLDNRIVAVRGFEPSLPGLLQNYGPAVDGRASVPGYITTGEDAALLTKRYAMTAERAISREAAVGHLAHMNSLKDTHLRWTGMPELAEAAGATDVSNCGRWAVHDAMRVAPEFAAELRIGQPGNPVPSSQGKIMAALKDLDKLQTAGEYKGPIVVGKPSPVVRGIGTGLFVLSGAVTIIQLKSAEGDPRQGELTGEAVGSLAGSLIVPEVGVALCAILGVATGGLALIPLAICFGIGGAEVGGHIGGRLGSGLDYHPNQVLSRYWSHGDSAGLHSREDIARVRGPQR
jgi:hypothetical protein